MREFHTQSSLLPKKERTHEPLLEQCPGWDSMCFSIVTSLWAGKDMVLGWFRDNKPSEEAEREKFDYVVNNLELTWDVLIWTSIASGVFLVWCIFSFWVNRGKRDWPDSKTGAQNTVDRILFARSVIC